MPAGVRPCRAAPRQTRNQRVNAYGRWLAITIGLLSALACLVPLIAHEYGKPRAARFCLGAAVFIMVQQFLLLCALQHRDERLHAQPLDLVDALTLSRGGVAAVIAGLIIAGIRDRTGLAGWLTWPLLLASVTLIDWIDGPLARRRGPTPLGRVLDIETDSCLSLVGDVAGSAWGDLPRHVMWPSLGRYLLPILSHYHGRYAETVAIGTTWWARGAGIAHGAAVIIALAPFGGRLAGRFAWVLATLASAAQLVCLAMILARICTPKASHHAV